MRKLKTELIQGEENILKELKSITDREELICEHLLSLERLLWQLLAELGKSDKETTHFDLQKSMERYVRLEEGRHKH